MSHIAPFATQEQQNKWGDCHFRLTGCYSQCKRNWIVCKHCMSMSSEADAERWKTTVYPRCGFYLCRAMGCHESASAPTALYCNGHADQRVYTIDLAKAPAIGARNAGGVDSGASSGVGRSRSPRMQRTLEDVAELIPAATNMDLVEFINCASVELAMRAGTTSMTDI